ncbi:DsbA family oxidoreductase [Thalassobacillus sp. CUG 92003]|uniref:DsbA family oxidoreductase n=1 Tax=Thalassobacillus sp. CUG 92003 TaxID=2736641 RepID=UPI0015E65894
MNVEVWSDIVCPFCYIGKRRFESALEQYEGRENVTIIFKSFQLDPNAKKEAGQDIHQRLATKYGVSYEEGKNMNHQMAEQAKEEGLDYHFDTIVPTNTLDAHRLTHYAKAHGKMNEMTERLMKAYFTDSLDIGDHDTLVDLAESVGLDKQASRNILEASTYEQNVIGEQQEGAELGVQGVPFFVFNRKYAVSGAQSPDTFLDVLHKVEQEDKGTEQ